MIGRDESSWLGDTSGYWDSHNEDIHEKGYREAREKAAYELQRQRATDGDQARKLVLNDDGWQVLGNAILLAWHLPDQRADENQRLVSKSELTELRGLLDGQGALAQEFHDLYGGSVASWWEALRALKGSKLALAILRAKDLCAQPGEGMPPEIEHALLVSPPYDLRQPLSRLGRCSLTLDLRDAVVRYFRGLAQPINSDEADQSASLGGPLSVPDRRRESAASKVLEKIYVANPDARLSKAEVFNLLVPYFPAENARDRIWGDIDAQNWKQPGRIPKAALRVDRDMAAAKLAAELK